MTIEQKKEAINKRLDEIYPQLKINCNQLKSIEIDSKSIEINSKSIETN